MCWKGRIVNVSTAGGTIENKLDINSTSNRIKIERRLSMTREIRRRKVQLFICGKERNFQASEYFAQDGRH